MPYEEITQALYDEMMRNIKPLNMREAVEEVVDVERFCDSDRCKLPGN